MECLETFEKINIETVSSMGVARFWFNGEHVGGRLPGGYMSESSRTPETFRKFSKNFLENWKMHYFSMFFKKGNKPCVNFSCVWTQTQIVFLVFLGNFESFRKFSPNFLIKFRKCIILANSFKNLTNALLFRVWTKNKLLGNFEKILKSFDENAI